MRTHLTLVRTGAKTVVARSLRPGAALTVRPCVERHRREAISARSVTELPISHSLIELRERHYASNYHHRHYYHECAAPFHMHERNGAPSSARVTSQV